MPASVLGGLEARGLDSVGGIGWLGGRDVDSSRLRALDAQRGRRMYDRFCAQAHMKTLICTLHASFCRKRGFRGRVGDRGERGFVCCVVLLGLT